MKARSICVQRCFVEVLIHREQGLTVANPEQALSASCASRSSHPRPPLTHQSSVWTHAFNASESSAACVCWT